MATHHNKILLIFCLQKIRSCQNYILLNLTGHQRVAVIYMVTHHVDHYSRAAVVSTGENGKPGF
jgi:hypothetical protein